MSRRAWVRLWTRDSWMAYPDLTMDLLPDVYLDGTPPPFTIRPLTTVVVPGRVYLARHVVLGA